MDLITNFFTQLQPFNLFDLIVLIIVFFYAYEGYSVGFVTASLDLFSFVVAFITGLKFYHVVASILTLLFSVQIGFSYAIGFFLVALITELFLNILLRKAIRYVPPLNPMQPLSQFLKKTDHFLGLFPGVISAFIILSFILTVIVSLPSSPLIKSMVTGSGIGGILVANTSLFEKRLNDIFGGALKETMNFLTVEPKTNEMVKLRFNVTDGIADPKSEQEMFAMINTQRLKNGLQPVSFDSMLRDVARAHSNDMFRRSYFSHYTPEGLSPFDRMKRAGIMFTYAGENLALSATTELAMQGLMNSLSHRANILNGNFHKVGVGVIDGGIYGKMYSQEFSD